MKAKTTMDLKRRIISAAAAVLLLSLLAAGIFITGNQTNLIYTARAQEETKSVSERTSAEGQYICSNETLEGRYAVIGDGFAAPPQNPPLLPFATVSLMTLDGAGNLTNKVTRSNNGIISRGIDVGTYTVNPDCTGTITIATPNPPFQLTFDLVVSDIRGAKQGREFYFIATTPGGAVTATAKRIQ